MKTAKKLGIWMDYAIAHIMEIKGKSILTTEIESEFTWEEKQHSFFRNEGFMHKKEREYVSNYFEKIEDHIASADEVVLFGPGDAKTELFNRLTADPRFKHIELSVKTTDNLTENQRQAFVKKHFQRKPNWSEIEE
jgi:stalled ribosome rescue protein Dom34